MMKKLEPISTVNTNKLHTSLRINLQQLITTSKLEIKLLKNVVTKKKNPIERIKTNLQSY